MFLLSLVAVILVLGVMCISRTLLQIRHASCQYLLAFYPEVPFPHQ
jgi:hypothetical protein